MPLDLCGRGPEGYELRLAFVPAFPPAGVTQRYILPHRLACKLGLRLLCSLDLQIAKRHRQQTTIFAMCPHSEITMPAKIPARKAGSGRTFLDDKRRKTRYLLGFYQIIESLWMSSEGVMAEGE